MLKQINQMIRNDKGFTLVELAVVMMVGGLLLAASARGLKSKVVQQKIDEQDQVMDSVTSALVEFIKDDRTIDAAGAPVNNDEVHWPCPADPTLGVGSDGFGKEVRAGIPTGLTDEQERIFVQQNDGLECDTTNLTVIGTGDQRIFIGAVPTVTLGLPAVKAIDAYGNKLTYAISVNYAESGALKNDTSGYEKPILIAAHKADGSLDTPLESQFALFSHGPDGSGAYTAAASTVVNPCGTAKDAKNCDFRTSSDFDEQRTFIDNSLDYSEAFDDNRLDDRMVFSIAAVEEDDQLWMLVGSGSVNPSDIRQVDTSGFVGIGEASPTEQLHVTGGTLLDGDAEVTGDTVIGGNADINGNATVTGNADINGNTIVNGSVGVGTDNPSERLSVAGEDQCLELGAGVTKEVNAGKLCYQRWGDGSSLDIVGAGLTGSQRTINFWAEGGSNFRGNIISQKSVRAGKGSPSGDGTQVGFAFETDGDTGMFVVNDPDGAHGGGDVAFYVDNRQALVVQNDLQTNALGGMRLGLVNSTLRSGATGGPRLHFSGAGSYNSAWDSENSDPLSMRRVNRSANRSEIEMLIGDDYGNSNFYDTFSIAANRPSSWGGHLFAVHSNRRVAINQYDARMTLDVNGEVKFGNTGAACTSSVAGGMRYSGGNMQYCNGSAWTNLSGGEGPQGPAGPRGPRGYTGATGATGPAGPAGNNAAIIARTTGDIDRLNVNTGATYTWDLAEVPSNYRCVASIARLQVTTGATFHHNYCHILHSNPRRLRAFVSRNTGMRCTFICSLGMASSRNINQVVEIVPSGSPEPAPPVPDDPPLVLGGSCGSPSGCQGEG